MKIFITGASGFIGQSLIKRLLKKGHRITALSRNPLIQKDIKNVKWIMGDVTNTFWHNKVKGNDIFIHLAGLHGYLKISKKERTNFAFDTARSVVKACKKKIKGLIFVSTALTDLKNEYAIAKEKEKNIIKKEFKKDLRGVIIDPVIVYGPGEDKNLGRLYKIIKNNKFAFIGNGENIWNLIYIDDLIDSLEIVIDNLIKLDGKEIIVAGESIKFKDFVFGISKELKVKKPSIFLPKTPMLFVGRIFSLLKTFGISLPFNYDTYLTLTKDENYILSKNLIELGFKPKITIKEGLKKTLINYEKAHCR